MSKERFVSFSKENAEYHSNEKLFPPSIKMFFSPFIFSSGDSLSSIEDIICENPEELVKTLVQLSNSDCTPSCKNQHSAKTNLNSPVV